jgi:hypothetical protein
MASFRAPVFTQFRKRRRNAAANSQFDIRRSAPLLVASQGAAAGVGGGSAGGSAQSLSAGSSSGIGSGNAAASEVAASVGVSSGIGGGNAAAGSLPVTTHVQDLAHLSLTGSGTVWTTPAFPAVGTGNALVFVVNTFVVGTVPVIAGITDDAGNNYVRLQGQTQYDSFVDDEQELWGLVNIRGNPTVLTVTYASSITSPVASIDGAEYSNVDSINDNTLQYLSSGSTTTPSVSLTTTVGGCVIWGYLNSTGTFGSQGAGFTLRNNDPVSGSFTEDLQQALPGAISVGWVLSGATAEGNVLAAVALAPARTPGASVLSDALRRRRRIAAPSSQFDVVRSVLLSSQDGIAVALGFGAAVSASAAAAASAGAASGAGSSSVVGQSTAASIGSSSGLGAASGASPGGSVALSAGIGAAVSVGAAAAASVGAASSVGTALALGPTIGTATGIGTAVAISTSGAVPVSESSPTSTAILKAIRAVSDFPQVAVEIDLYSDKKKGIKTLRLCDSGPLFSQNASGEQYEPRLITPILLGAAISAQSYGQPMRALSNHGEINFILDEDYASEVFDDDLHWVGRKFRVYEGVTSGMRFVEELDLVFQGRIADVTHDTLTATIKTGDASVDIDIPLISEFYPDTAPAAIAGKPVPEVWGNVFCVEPALTDTANEVYKLSRSPIFGPVILRVGGIAWPKSVTNPPPSGFWYFNPATRRITLGADPLGGDVRADAQASADTIGIGELIQQILSEQGMAVDVAAMNEIDHEHPFIAGYFAKDPINVIAVLDDAFTGAACWWGTTLTGAITGGFIGPPKAKPDVDVVLDKTNIMSLTQSQTIPPIWRVKIEFERHWQIENQFFDAVDAVEKQRWSSSGLIITRQDQSILTAEPRAFDVPTIRSVVTNAADATTIANIFWDAWSVKRVVLDVAAMIDPTEINLYDTISVNYMMFKKNFRIISAIRSIGGGPAQLQLWG